MEAEFVPYEQALALKELGFESPYPIGGYQGGKVFYYEKGELYYDGRPMYSSDAHSGQVLAPLYQQAFRWFREKYNLDCGIHAYSEMDFKTEEITKKYTGRVDDWNTILSIHDGTGLIMPKHYHFEVNSYEEAELECLKALIEIVKQK
jgi:hypothetical protein